MTKTEKDVREYLDKFMTKEQITNVNSIKIFFN